MSISTVPQQNISRKSSYSPLLEFYKDDKVVAQFINRLQTMPDPKGYVSCNLCGSSESTPHMKLAQFQVVKCSQCSLIYVNPRFDAQQQAEFYSTQDYYLSGYDAEGNLHNMLDEKKVKQADLIYELQAIEKSKGGKFLDIGCGLGFLLELLSPQKWDRHGCDFSPFAVEHCQKSNFGTIKQGDLATIKYPNAFFDVVAARYVLEHLSDPKQFLKEVRRILKPGGKFVISIPNWGGFCAKWFGEFFRLNSPEEHIYWYTPRTLRKYIEATGFAVDKVEYPYLKTSYFNFKELKNLVYRLFLLKIKMPLLMKKNQRLSECVISPPFYGNILMMTVRAV